MEGRWPANVILDPSMAQALDEQSGITKSSKALSKDHSGQFFLDGCRTVDELRALAERGERTPKGRDASATLARYEAGDSVMRGHDDEGGASRFFLQAGYEQWELEWILANGLRPCGMENE